MNHWVKESRLRRARREFYVSLYRSDKAYGTYYFCNQPFSDVANWTVSTTISVDGVIVWCKGVTVWEVVFSSREDLEPGSILSVNLRGIVEVMK